MKNPYIMPGISLEPIADGTDPFAAQDDDANTITPKKNLNKISKFKGKNISDMSREELIEALEISFGMIESERKELSRRTEFLLDLL